MTFKFTITRTTEFLNTPCQVFLGVSGSAIVNIDYTIAGYDSINSNYVVVVIPSGQTTTDFILTPLIPGGTVNSAAIFQIAPSPDNNYEVGSNFFAQAPLVSNGFAPT